MVKSTKDIIIDKLVKEEESKDIQREDLSEQIKEIKLFLEIGNKYNFHRMSNAQVTLEQFKQRLAEANKAAK